MKPLNNVQAHLWISGIVQGVFFRAYTQEKAIELGVNGWVRNIPNQVEAVLVGEKEKVEEMIQWCRHGPPNASVTKVDIAWETPENLKGFRIIYAKDN